jgi:hypothetical protein
MARIVTGEEKLVQAKAALLDFQSKHPRSREDVQEGAVQWLADARRVTQMDVGGYIAGGGSLHPDHMAAAVTAYVVGSEGFAAWLMEQVDAGGLLPRRKREGEIKRLAKVVSDAETAIVRAQLEADTAAAEAKLAELVKANT